MENQIEYFPEDSESLDDIEEIEITFCDKVYNKYIITKRKDFEQQGFIIFDKTFISQEAISDIEEDCNITFSFSKFALNNVLKTIEEIGHQLTDHGYEVMIKNSETEQPILCWRKRKDE